MSIIHMSFRAFSHATEDVERVRMAMKFASGCEDFEESVNEGYHGNRIRTLKCDMKKKDDTRKFFRRLSEDDIRSILDTLDQRMDEDCNIFFRLDKQAAYMGDLKVTSVEDCIAIRAKVESYPKRRETAMMNARKFLESLLPA